MEGVLEVIVVQSLTDDAEQDTLGRWLCLRHESDSSLNTNDRVDDESRNG
jgi:hypothetical protein